MLKDSAVAEILVRAYRCERCEHVWVPRGKYKDVEPPVCPKCKSAYWNRPRKSDEPTNAVEDK